MCTLKTDCGVCGVTVVTGLWSTQHDFPIPWIAIDEFHTISSKEPILDILWCCRLVPSNTQNDPFVIRLVAQLNVGDFYQGTRVQFTKHLLYVFMCNVDWNTWNTKSCVLVLVLVLVLCIMWGIVRCITFVFTVFWCLISMDIGYTSTWPFGALGLSLVFILHLWLKS